LAFCSTKWAYYFSIPHLDRAFNHTNLIRCTNDLLLSYLFYRKEALAPYWSNAFATQMLGYETPEHNIVYAQ
jgi:hypothetical protein